MIEQETSDLDLYADLSVEGEDVEGLTEFYRNKKPSVKIARELSLDLSRYSRLRTTLAHEYGHVKFHAFLGDLDLVKKSTSGVLSKIPVQRRRYQEFRERLASRYALHDSCPPLSNSAESTFLTGCEPDAAFRCKQSRMVDAPFSDWMEWQASYVSGAILMPLSSLRSVIRPDVGEGDSLNWLSSDSDSAKELVTRVSTAFDVSADTARIRLEKLGFLQNTQSGYSLNRLSATVPTR
jgi:Zn-dependent peptidase ImmA (M78 family)